MSNELPIHLIRLTATSTNRRHDQSHFKRPRHKFHLDSHLNRRRILQNETKNETTSQSGVTCSDLILSKIRRALMRQWDLTIRRRWPWLHIVVIVLVSAVTCWVAAAVLSQSEELRVSRRPQSSYWWRGNKLNEKNNSRESVTHYIASCWAGHHDWRLASAAPTEMCTAVNASTLHTRRNHISVPHVALDLFMELMSFRILERRRNRS